MRAFLNWASSIIFLVLLVWLLSVFAHDRLRGFPDDPEKNVSLASSSSPSDDLVVMMQPPMSARQMPDRGQELALQFFNRSKKKLQVLPVRVVPSACFSLQTVDSQDEKISRPMKPKETRMIMVRLSFAASCVGEEHPLTLIYSWKTIASPQPSTAAKERGGRRRRTSVIAPTIEERSISTTPIGVTSETLNGKERFVKLGKLVLLPVLLAVVTFIFQRFQAARDEIQNAENLKIEVWKAIQPSFLEMVKRYYSPILRRMVAIRGHIKDNGSSSELLVLMLLLRRQMLLLLENDAGYYFQSKPGEELVGLLNDPMIERWRRAMPNFDDIALLLTGSETLPVAVTLLRAAGIDLGLSSQFIDKNLGLAQARNLRFFDRSLKLFVLVLAFEVDRPFYPVWYERRFPPTMEVGNLKTKINWYPATGRNELALALETYRRSIPWICVSDKTVAERLRRIGAFLGL